MAAGAVSACSVYRSPSNPTGFKARVGIVVRQNWSFFRSVSALVLMASTFGFGPCGGVASESFGNGDRSTPTAGSDAPSGSFPGTDAGTKAAPFRGNPLCHVLRDDQTSCMPDNATNTSGGIVCKAAGGDGGQDAGAIEGCRLVAGSQGGNLTPDCQPATLAGTDGVSCSSGSDCAPGFDCVDEKDGPVCRRYCCLDKCESGDAGNDASRFCDIQRLVDPSQKAPVCIPLKPCKLLEPNECPSTETCGIVSESGATGCVMIGTGQPGSSCDDVHCGEGLTCLGQVGSRKCYELCHVGETNCGSSQICKTSTIFLDPTIGVCQKP